jgi:hypothetical protein
MIHANVPSGFNREKAFLILLVLLAFSFPNHAHGNQGSNTQESCRKFVQEFYTWYVRFSSKEGGSSEALKQRPRSFDPELLRRMKQDADAQAKQPGEIVGLDFDPFLNAQDIAPRYVVGKVTRKGDRYRVEVYGIWNGKKDEIPSVVPELMYSNGHWRFMNFYYRRDTKKPREDDLLSVLKELRKDRKKAGK